MGIFKNSHILYLQTSVTACTYILGYNKTIQILSVVKNIVFYQKCISEVLYFGFMLLELIYEFADWSIHNLLLEWLSAFAGCCKSPGMTSRSFLSGPLKTGILPPFPHSSFDSSYCLLSAFSLNLQSFASLIFSLEWSCLFEVTQSIVLPLKMRLMCFFILF